MKRDILDRMVKDMLNNEVIGRGVMTRSTDHTPRPWRLAARRLGIPVEEYVARRLAGETWDSHTRKWVSAASRAARIADRDANGSFEP